VHENLLVGLEARKDNLLSVPEDIYELFPVLKACWAERVVISAWTATAAGYWACISDESKTFSP